MLGPASGSFWLGCWAHLDVGDADDAAVVGFGEADDGEGGAGGGAGFPVVGDFYVVTVAAKLGLASVFVEADFIGVDPLGAAT